MLPLVIGVQEACGRIGNITGKGLARNIEDRYSLHTLRLLVVLLAAANVINIGAIGSVEQRPQRHPDGQTGAVVVKEALGRAGHTRYLRTRLGAGYPMAR